MKTQIAFPKLLTNTDQQRLNQHSPKQSKAKAKGLVYFTTDTNILVLAQWGKSSSRCSDQTSTTEQKCTKTGKEWGKTTVRCENTK